MILQARIETDPADRTQLRLTVASGDPTLTFEYVFKIFLSHTANLSLIPSADFSDC